MARHETTVTVTEEGRDKGKVFLITEMPARFGHKWATRAMFSVMNSGVEVPENILTAGMAGFAMLGLQSMALVPFEMAEPLMDELLACVEFIPDPEKPHVKRRLFESDIEEILTIFKLQKEALNLHVEPFTNGVKSILALTPKPETPAS